MKKLFLTGLIFFLGVAVALAGDVSFMWDANTEPDIAGYRLFMHTEGVDYDYVNPVVECPGTGATVTNLTPGQTYYFVLRAFDTEDFESGNSKEVTHNEPNIWEGRPPANPTGLIKK